MRFPPGFAETVREQADIVRIISDYVALKKRGANYVARCPFHSEKTPSFTVHAGKGIYKCFGCGAGGSVFNFIMQIEGCSFAESVRIVAEKSGIPIPAIEVIEDHKKAAQEREVVLRLNELAAQFFQEQLFQKESEHALQYIISRGITDETRQLFRIGYSPDRRDALIGFLKKQGVTREEIELSGLASVKEQGELCDRFRGRVIFPITDSQNRVIAFGGRVIGEGEPKYLNSPETAVYNKGRNLYGLALAKNEIRRLGYALLVEGYFDCIILFQEGIRNVVASLGTALTENQVRLLRRYLEQPQIVVSFDADSAGHSATMRSIELLLAEGFKVNVLRMPSGKDPDEFVRTHGVQALRALLRTSQPYIEYIIEQSFASHDISRPSGKVEAINAILPHLVRMRDKVERADYAEQIADRLKLDSRIIREELKRTATNRQTALDAKRLRSLGEITQAERQLLEVMLANADVRRAVIPGLKEEDYSDLATGNIFEAIMSIEREGLEPDYLLLSERVESDHEREIISELLMSDLAWAGGDDFDTLFKKATEALYSLRRKSLEKKLDAIQIEIAQAERENDSERVLQLFLQKARIKKQMLQLSGQVPD
jgi:DNA primase